MVLVSTAAIFSLMAVGANGSSADRDRVLKLLAAGSVNNNPIGGDLALKFFSDGASFAELKRSVKGSSNSTPPRRRGHPSCECPDAPGDVNHDDCIARRIDLLTQSDAALATADSAGMSTSLGIQQLRMDFDSVNDLATMEGNQNDNLFANGTNYLYAVNNEGKHILNYETGMAKSSNSYWMSLIKATGLLDKALNDVMNLDDAGTSGMAGYMNTIEQQEETMNFGNMKQMGNAIGAETSSVIAMVTDSETQVYNQLVALDNGMSNAEDFLQDLTASLQGAESDLTSAVMDFNSSIPHMPDTVDATLSNSYASLMNQFGTSSQLATDSYTSGATNKIAASRNQTTNSIADQDNNSAAQMMGNTRNTTMSQINPLFPMREQWSTSSGTAFESISDSVYGNTSNLTGTYQTHVQTINNNLTLVSTTQNQMNSTMSTIINTERTDIANSNNALQSTGYSTGQNVNRVLSTVNQLSTDNLQQVSTIGSAAPDAVGTSTQSSLQNLNTQYTQMQSTIGSNVNSAASGSSSAASNLAQAAITGNNQIDSARDGINSQLQSGYVDNLNGLTGVAGSLSVPSVDVNSITAQHDANMANTLGIVQMAQNSNATTVSLTAQTGAQLVVQMLLQLIGGNATNIDALTQTIASSLSQLQSKQVSGTGTVSDTDASVRGAMSLSGGLVGDSSDNYAQFFLDQLEKAQALLNTGNGANAILGTSTTLQSSSNTIADANGNIDSTNDQIAKNTQDANAQVVNAQGVVANVNTTVSSTVGGTSKNIDSTTFGAQSDVDSAASGASSDASDQAGLQSSQIQAFGSNAQAAIDKASTDQMTQIRDLAASVDAVLDQLSDYMSQNGPQMFQATQHLNVTNTTIYNLVNQQGASILNAKTTALNNNNSAVTDLQNLLIALNSTAYQLLNQIQTNLTLNADSYTASVLQTVTDKINEFGQTTNNIQSNIAGSTTGLKSNLTTATGTALSANDVAINNLFDQLNSMTQGASNSITQIQAAIANDTSSDTSSATQNSTDVLAALSANAQFASNTLSGLLANANQLNQSANGIVAGGNDTQAAIDQQAAQAQLAAQVGTNGIQGQQNNVNALNGATTDSASALAATIQSDIAAKQQQTSLIYDNVMASQSQVSSQISSILNAVSQTGSNQSATVTTNAQQTQFQAASMQAEVQHLMNVFQSYLDTQNTQFAQTQNSFQDFVNSVALKAAQELTGLDVSLANQDVQLNDDISLVQHQVVANITESDLETDLDATNQQVEDWATNEFNQLGSIQGSATSVDQGGYPKTEMAAIQSKINSAIQSIALQAKQNLLSAGKVVPQTLTNILQQPAQR